MKIDLPELERKLSYGINLTIKESTILLESMKGFIDDKIELQEQLNTAKKALTEISKTKDFYRSGRDHWEEFSQDALKAQKALAAMENEGSGDE